jgi:hypothetical protein
MPATALLAIQEGDAMTSSAIVIDTPIGTVTT